jgi:hypothetical protein
MLVSNSFAKLLLSVGLMPAAITIAIAQVSSPAAAAASSQPAISASDLGVTFLPGSASQLVIERNGKRYLVDIATNSVREDDTTTAQVSATSPATPAA